MKSYSIYTINDMMRRENKLFKRKLLRTIAKLGLVKILSISNNELDEMIFVYNEYDSKPIISNLANILVNVFDEESNWDDCVGRIINKKTMSIARAFM